MSAISKLNVAAKFIRDESGTTAMEYALIAALLSVSIVASLGFASPQVISLWTTIGTILQSASAAAGGG